MIRHGFFDAPSTLDPSSEVLKAMHALYWRGGFLGTCVAVLPRVLVTAGHHFNAVKDDVGDFAVRHPDMPEARVEHALKDGANDILVLWVDTDLDHIPLRGFLPPLQARVATVWLSTKWPHETIVSPGVVIESTLLSCVARGTVSTSGSSGAPVIDHFGDHVVGMHLTSNTRDGSRVSGFIPARKIVSVLAEMGVSCRAD
ncbi:putative trypsin-like cysteine/serine peptidase [Trypanosoma conorhini]|uniref:Putative trypsin-like cysteine/serine peptidase n=1 Tax=Trypanosoma conorhini TaxID=83891 RepID=A0A3R7KI20_9TRYP|nr:putative trypsin-like cysteine/serine peptidase [Trypanosoma conorhini]RNF08059.1 putative trypsin-like cysteine/serine peptidase [Trypanosoma conorhini]